MTRNTVLCIGLLAAVLSAACGKKEEPPVAPAQGQQAAPAPAPQAVGDSCSKDCGGGNVVAITCAEGETPSCECGPPPVASCRVPAPK